MITWEEWRREGERRFGPDFMDWRFVCPSCGHVQTGHALEAAGVPRDKMNIHLGETCVGFFRGVERPGKGSGCRFEGPGPVTVIRDGVYEYRVFDFAT